MKTDRDLHLILAGVTDEPSFRPQDSDSLLNAMHVEQLVGTLVRMSPSGRYEPFLADSWTVSGDKKVWTFTIRSGLACSDGSPINALTFEKSFLRVLNLLIQDTPLPLIKNLKGWLEFFDRRQGIEGIKALDQNRLEFRFETAPSSGFIEYLALPYFGFYCESNFTEKGDWKDQNTIVSSSSYVVADRTSRSIKLMRRYDWPILKESSPNSVRIDRLLEEEIPSAFFSKNTIIFKRAGSTFSTPKGFSPYRSLPTILHAVVINPSRSGSLARPAFRQSIRQSILAEIAKTDNWPVDFTPSSNVYPHLSTQREQRKTLSNLEPVTEPLIVYTKDSGNALSGTVEGTLIRALKQLGLPFEVKKLSNVHSDFMRAWKDESKFDLKLIAVDVGGGIETQLLKFMFCSKLGVSFPDPSGRICELTDEFERRYGDMVEAGAVQEYVNRMDQIVEEDAAVIPIGHAGPIWLVGDGVQIDGISPNLNPIYFDSLGLK